MQRSAARKLGAIDHACSGADAEHAQAVLAAAIDLCISERTPMREDSWEQETRKSYHQRRGWVVQVWRNLEGY
jgi:hypothetical protein